VLFSTALILPANQSNHSFGIQFMSLRLFFLFKIWIILRWRGASGFIPQQKDAVTVVGATRQTSPLGLSAVWNDDDNSENRSNRRLKDSGKSPNSLQERWLALSRAQLQIPATTKLLPLHWLGKASLPTSAGSIGQGGLQVIKNRNQTCLVLALDADNFQSPLSDSYDEVETSLIAALLVPLQDDNLLRPLQAAQQGEKLSPQVLWRLNTLLVNRDGGLFDNIPWSTWTVDPLQRNVDAAGNPIDARYHMGKRDAYNVLLGKDWTWKELVMGASSKEPEIDGEVDNKEDDETVLARRLVELQRRETQMDLAEVDYLLAVAQTMDEAWALEEQRQMIVDRLDTLQAQWNKINESKDGGEHGSATVFQERTNLIQSIVDQWENRPKAPYRGATGYKAWRKNDEDVSNSVFTSPFAMIREILRDQLKARVIGVFLENTSLLQGTTALGGVLVLQRITAQTTSMIAGETVSVSNESEDYGNPGIVGGEMVIVECDAAEALGMSLACEVPLHISNDIWERCSVMVEFNQYTEASGSLYEFRTVDPELSVLMEGQAGNQSATERVLPLRSPRGATSLFDSILQPSTPTSNELFPTDNPIQSLSQLDQLSNEDKARTLLSLSNFDSRLPRPRAVQESEQGAGSMNALDRLLLPLIDESVRREYYIRQAVQQGDLELAQELESSKSMRQIAKEKLEQARMAGDQEGVAYWQNEVNLYASLRADVTQDEGSYSRFLDRDEWYERERLRTAARVDRKKFGNLLDGIE
jgi:hypothetical protein